MSTAQVRRHCTAIVVELMEELLAMGLQGARGLPGNQAFITDSGSQEI